MHFMNTKGVEYSAAVTSKAPGGRVRAEAGEFRKSKHNPRNQSRTRANKISGHAPSARVLDYARRSARALAELALAPSAAWKLLQDADGDALLFELTADDPRRVRDSEYYSVRAVATVDAVVDDVLSLVSAPTTEELLDAGRALFGTYFHAGVTLNKLTCSTPPAGGGGRFFKAGVALDKLTGSAPVGQSAKYSADDAYAVHWLSLRSVSKLGSVDNHRDMTVVGYQDTFDLSSPGSPARMGRSAARAQRGSQRLLGVHSLVSTTLADVPPLPKSEATDRVHLRDSGLVVEPLSPGMTRVSLVLSLLPSAGANSSAEAKKRARRARKWLQLVAVAGVTSLAAMVAAKFPPARDKENRGGGGNLGLAIQPVDPRHWRESDHCYICLKAFRAFRRQHHCRFCGEAVCGSCSGYVDSVTGRAVDSGDWSSNGGNGSAGSAESLSGRERANSNDKSAAAAGSQRASNLRACNACAYELEQRLSGAHSSSDRRSAASSSSHSNDSISLSLYSVDRLPADSGFSLSLPDFADVLDERDDGTATASGRGESSSAALRRPPPPSYQFALAMQRGQLNASVSKKLWTSSDSLGAAMRGLEQYNASLSTASSSLLSQRSGIPTASGGGRYDASLSDQSTASLSSLRSTPSRFVDLSAPVGATAARYQFSSFGGPADGAPSVSGSISSASSAASFTDVSNRPRNDMIPLAPPRSAQQQFVVFSSGGSDSSSDAGGTASGRGGAGDASGGGDMIPLTLL